MTGMVPTSLITALDHFVLLCADYDQGVDCYTRLMGFGPSWSTEADGRKTALFQTQNTAVELVAPSGTSADAQRIRDLLGEGVRLASLVYRTPQAREAHRVLGRRGLVPGPLEHHHSKDLVSGQVRDWTRFRLGDDSMAGVKSFVLEPSDPAEAPARDKGSVKELDHLVIQTPNPDRAVANYGGRLGLRLALDRSEPRWDTRFLFFRLGGLSLEIVQRLGETASPAESDHLWGLTWGTDDIEVCHHRLQYSGADLSPVRDGRKPGTRIFTLRDGNLGVPTLFIQQGAS